MVMHGVNTIIEWRVRVPVNFDLPHPLPPPEVSETKTRITCRQRSRFHFRYGNENHTAPKRRRHFPSMLCSRPRGSARPCGSYNEEVRNAAAGPAAAEAREIRTYTPLDFYPRDISHYGLSQG